MPKKSKPHEHRKRRLAIFDIDGTLFRSALMMEVVDRMIQRGLLPEREAAAVVEAQNAWKNRKGKFELYNERFMKLMEKDFRGVEIAAFEDIAEQVIAETKDHQYRFSHNLMEQLREQNFVLVAISGMLERALTIYNRYLRFDYVFGSELETEGGTFTDRSRGLSPYEDKSKVVKYFLSEHADTTLDGSYGIGDTESDVGFLDMVEHPIAFNPNKKLFQTARDKGWRIVVERKDMIYDLSGSDYEVQV